MHSNLKDDTYKTTSISDYSTCDASISDWDAFYMESSLVLQVIPGLDRSVWPMVWIINQSLHSDAYPGLLCDYPGLLDFVY